MLAVKINNMRMTKVLILLMLNNNKVIILQDSNILQLIKSNFSYITTETNVTKLYYLSLKK